MLLDLFGCQLKMPAEILLAKSVKDGTVTVVSKSPALLAPSIMEPNVFVLDLKNINANLGNTSTESNVFTFLNNAHLEHNGIKPLVYP